MRRTGIFFLTFLLTTTLSCTPKGVGVTYPAPPARQAKIVDSYGAGFLMVDGKRRLIHVKGTPYEMGFQYGYLLEKDLVNIVATLETMLASQSIPGHLSGPIAVFASTLFRPYIPADVMNEIRGMLAGARHRNPMTSLLEHELIFLNCLIDFGAVLQLTSINCTGMAVWGSRTQGGKVFQTRNVDLFIGTGLEKYPIVAIHKPDGKIPYANAGWVGFLGCVTGLNGHGLGISQVWAKSTDRQFGKPWPLITRQIMQEGIGVADAVRLIGGEPKRTYGCNFIFADRGDGRGGQPAGVAIEMTANHFASFKDNDPREYQALWNGQNYNVTIPEAVFRGDCALDPKIRSKNIFSNGPTGDPRTAKAYKSRYKGQADRILAHQRSQTLMGQAEAEQLSRQVAMPKCSLQCAVMNNTDLKLWVSNSRIDSNGTVYPASKETYHFYDFDHYVPRTDLTVTGQVFRPGDTIPCTLATGNLGTARKLDLHFYLDIAGIKCAVGKRLGVNYTRSSPGTLNIPIRLPLLIPIGKGHLIVDAMLAGTNQLVDSDAVEIRTH